MVISHSIFFCQNTQKFYHNSLQVSELRMLQRKLKRLSFHWVLQPILLKTSWRYEQFVCNQYSWGIGFIDGRNWRLLKWISVDFQKGIEKLEESLLEMNQPNMDKIEKCLQEVSKLFKDAASYNPQGFILMKKSNRPSSAGFCIICEGMETLPWLIFNFFIEFEIQQPHGKFTICRIQHPKHFLS